MSAYYNEFDKGAAAWLRELIKRGLIAPGDVDERSIVDVRPDDLAGYRQCHFFAGIGGWSYALRLAGWPDDRPVWTGSCPCQPFSTAGKGGGFDDERHLWPSFHWLIAQCRPPVVLGEQVASKAAEPWIDLVQADLEGVGYAFGCVPFPAAGVGAPHIRDRMYWVADSGSPRPLPGPHAGVHSQKDGAGARHGEPQRPGAVGGVGHAHGAGLQGRSTGAQGERQRASVPGWTDRLADADSRVGGQGRADVRGWADRGDAQPRAGLGGGVLLSGLADDFMQQRPNGQSGIGHEHDPDGRLEGAAAATGLRSDCRPGPVNGYWRDSDWLFCRDGKWRSVEPGTFPLAHGIPARVGRLRGYGNAIVPQVAAEFISAFIDVTEQT